MRKIYAIILCLCLFLCACSSADPAAPTATQPTASTAPSTTPPTETTEPIVTDRCYRLAEADPEAKEILGLSQSPWLLFFDDGTGICGLYETPTNMRWNDSVFWDHGLVYSYTLADDRMHVSILGCELAFIRSAQLPAETVPPTEVPEDLAYPLAMPWLGWCDLQMSGASNAEGTVGSAVLAEFITDENGQQLAQISFATHDGEALSCRFFTQYHEGFGGYMLLGDYYGIPCLADSSCYFADGKLQLTLRVGDPQAADSYFIFACLRPLDDAWDYENDDPALPPSLVRHYRGMTTEQILADFASETGITLDLYEQYASNGWAMPTVMQLTGTWTIETTTPDGQPLQFFLELMEDETARMEWLNPDDPASHQTVNGHWRAYTDGRTCLHLELDGADDFPVLISPDEGMLFLGSGQGEPLFPFSAYAETMITVLDRSVG